MRKTFFARSLLAFGLLFSLFLAAAPATAQNIKNGSHWFDGKYFYDATVDGNNVNFESFNYQGDGPYFTLRKVADEAGAYIFSMKSDAESLSKLRTEAGSRAVHIRESGMNFIAIHDKEGHLVGTMFLTPDTLDSVYASEEWAESQPVDEMLDTFLMNTTYLGKFPRQTIELMLEELIAISGKNPGVIARTNIELMRSELRVSDDGRLSPYQEFTVSNEREFLQALGSNRTINLADDTHLMLSKILNDEDACTELGILMVGEYADLDERSGAMSGEVFDGRELLLKDISKLTIRGGFNCSIEVEPRYARVMRFVRCEDIVIDNLTIGHTPEGYCEGSVLGFESCFKVNVWRSSLYGCGTYGIEARNCETLYVSASIIRDCSYGIMDIYGCSDLSFENCDFFRNREFTLVSIGSDSSGCTFYKCRFAQNQGKLFGLGTEIRMTDCEVHHDLVSIGNVDKINDTNTTWDSSKAALGGRAIGPDSGAEVY